MEGFFLSRILGWRAQHKTTRKENANMKKLHKNGGFTLIEMLIVVAIIAILIAVSIPLINSALESARDATDQANERAAKAEATLILAGVTENNIKQTNLETGVYYDAVKGSLETSDANIAGYGKCTVEEHCKANSKEFPNSTTDDAIKTHSGGTYGGIIKVEYKAPAAGQDKQLVFTWVAAKK